LAGAEKLPPEPEKKRGGPRCRGKRYRARVLPYSEIKKARFKEEGKENALLDIRKKGKEPSLFPAKRWEAFFGREGRGNSHSHTKKKKRAGKDPRALPPTRGCCQGPKVTRREKKKALILLTWCDKRLLLPQPI